MDVGKKSTYSPAYSQSSHNAWMLEQKELNELAVVMALGIDTHENGYAVSAQVLNSSETGSKKADPWGVFRS